MASGRLKPGESGLLNPRAVSELALHPERELRLSLRGFS